jgi:integrase
MASTRSQHFRPAGSPLRETLIRKQQEDNKRRRRLSEDEETKLLAVAPPFLRSMIVAAVDTGMRRGEMLALRFGDIDDRRQLIVLRGETTKSKRTRVVPISTARLKAVVDWYVSTQTRRGSRPRRSCSAMRPASQSADSEPRG